MGRRLKQIKRDNLGASAKKLWILCLALMKTKSTFKEESHEQMRCK